MTDETTAETPPAVTPEAPADIFAIIGDPEKQRVASKVLTIPDQDGNKQEITFNILELSMREVIAIEAKKYAVATQTPEALEAEKLAWQIHTCVVKNVAEADNPMWVPLWSMVEIRGHTPLDARKAQEEGKPLETFSKGLMGHPSTRAATTIDIIKQWVWEVNPGLDPTRRLMAWAMRGQS